MIQLWFLTTSPLLLLQGSPLLGRRRRSPALSRLRPCIQGGCGKNERSKASRRKIPHLHGRQEIGWARNQADESATLETAQEG